MGKVPAIVNGQITEVGDQEVDVELQDPQRLFSTHINQIPMHGATQVARFFYGARFYNQALPLVKGEAPLVQNLTEDGTTSFDEKYGEWMGAMRAKVGGRVRNVTEDSIELETEDGPQVLDLYHNFPFNRKSKLTQIPIVKPGDSVEPGQLLARSNFTDDKGTSALTINARTGLVPYKGYSMDDAIVISESMAKKLTSNQTYTEEVEYESGTKGGLGHFQSLFPTEYKQDQLKKLDKDGVVKPGQVLEEGDPYVLLTRPRMFTSNEGGLGKLSRAMRDARQNSSLIWDHPEPARVTDVVRTRKGVKVVLDTETPAKTGDKLAGRHGAKAIISKILPDEHMPRTVDGEPLEVLLNPLSLNSRVNAASVYEMLLGKIAKKRGEPYKLPPFNQDHEKWYEFVQAQLDKYGVPEQERVFDPMEQKELEQPITTGFMPWLKLHHLGASKSSMRSQGSYDADQMPLKGGSESAQSKRLGSLELGALLSSGAYATMREASTLRGQRNDAYWRALRQGQATPEPGTPFVWDKFRALLIGSGLLSRDLGDGRLRLGPFTDRELDKLKAKELANGGIVNVRNFEPEPGGLFDPALVGNDKWAQITLPEPVPNPAFEKQIALLLGIRQKDLTRVLEGDMTLEEAQEAGR